MDSQNFISASEIGDYIYCKRGWWLRIQGKLPTTEAMQAGTLAHDSLLARLVRLARLQTVLMWGGVIVLIIIILLLLFI